LRDPALELLRDEVVHGTRGRRGHAGQEERQLRTFCALGFFLRNLRGGVTDRDEHRQDDCWSLRLGRTHCDEGVQKRSVESQISRSNEVTEVIEHGADLSARCRLIQSPERRVECGAHVEEPLQNARAQCVVRTCQWRHRRHLLGLYLGANRGWYAAPSRMTGAVGAGKGGRILVVDDEPMVRDTLGQVLVDEGYVVDTAVDGEDALDRVHDARPDAILLDLMMPGMNGRQFLQHLRNEADYAEVPVLIMTAVHGLEVNLASIGASEVVEKPFNIDDLLNKVALAVYRSRDADRVAHGPYISGPVELPLPPKGERGVVLVVEQDRQRLQQLDLVLSERGYTVVSTTRALAQLSRLARAIRPHAILLELTSEGVESVARDLRAGSETVPILVYSRGRTNISDLDTLETATDSDLLAYVDKQR